MTEIVLLGGGHSHVAVLKHFAERPLPGARVTVISRHALSPYSGMLPGVIAGHYTAEDAHIDLQPLARYAGARAIIDEAIGLDLAARSVMLAHRPPVPYDVLSINVGSTPNVTAPGAAAHAIAVKPIDQFLARWDALCARIVADEGGATVAVVGGGAGGVELILSVERRLRTLLETRGRDPRTLRYSLFTSAADILPTHNARARRLLRRHLSRRGVQVHTRTEILEVGPRQLRSATDGFDADHILWTTEAQAPPWVGQAGLATDADGFVLVTDALQSVSHAEVFAAGDVASIVGQRVEKSGVYAVREGAVLGPNLQRAVEGLRLRRYRPQRRFLSLISTGDRNAVAARGPFAFEGRWVWRWKDAIDRRFMRKYNDLPSKRAAPA